MNGLNQYVSAGPATFAYDANGNLASTVNAPTSTAYVYDVENRLVSASGSHNAELVYDPLGRLSRVSGSGGANVRHLVYDGDALIAEYDAAGNMPHRYIHGNDPGADDPLVWYHNAVYGWRQVLFHDHQGSIVGVTDMYANSIAANSYDPWGIPGANNIGRFGYTGQTWVPELGLWYYKARFYSPTTGRFLQIDPVGYADQMNLYAYVGNDPVNRVDPTGTTCTQVGEQRGGAAKYECRIDKVALVTRGRVVGTRDPTAREERRFAAFNTKYTAAVNRLARDPNHTVTVAPIKGNLGSFQISAGQAAASLIAREFRYVDSSSNTRAMVTGGGPGIDGGPARTYVYRNGLMEGATGIVHDGGMHGTPQEFTGGLQNSDNVLGKNDFDHQTQYNEAACRLLKENGC